MIQHHGWYDAVVCRLIITRKHSAHSSNFLGSALLTLVFGGLVRSIERYKNSLLWVPGLRWRRLWLWSLSRFKWNNCFITEITKPYKIDTRQPDSRVTSSNKVWTSPWSHGIVSQGPVREKKRLNFAFHLSSLFPPLLQRCPSLDNLEMMKTQRTIGHAALHQTLNTKPSSVQEATQKSTK